MIGIMLANRDIMVKKKNPEIPWKEFTGQRVDAQVNRK